MCHIDMDSLGEFKIKGKKISGDEKKYLASYNYKWCSKCKSAKPFSEFTKSKQTSDGYNGQCKSCKVEYRAENADRLKENDRARYWSNPERFREMRREYVKSNYNKVKESKKDYYERKKDVILAKNNEYRLNNLEHVKYTQKQYYRRNKGKKALQNKVYRRLNKDKINQYIRSKYNNDLNFRLKTVCRQLIRRMYLSIGSSKEGNTKDLLGYSPLDLKEHIESQFKPGMSWDNYGDWHIDHIIPISRATNLKEGLELSNLENLQPLWAYDNILKSNN